MGKEYSERKLDIPARSHPDYSSIKHILKSGKTEDLELYFKRKAEIREEWENGRLRVCARCGIRKYRELFNGESKYCRKCVSIKKSLSKQKKKIHKYTEGKSQTNYYAKMIVYGLKKLGVLKPLPCEVCGSSTVEAHHFDYNTPWIVMWLCKKHHKEWHEKNEPKRIS